MNNVSKDFDPPHKERISIFKKKNTHTHTHTQIFMSLYSERLKPDIKPLDIYCFNSKGPVDSSFST